MKIDLVFIAYNRLNYTKLSLSSLLKDPNEEFTLTIWDNGSTDGTREYLDEVEDSRITRKVFPKENAHLHGAINNFIEKSKADLIGIIPNDFILTAGWTKKIAQAHAEIPELGMIGCWHFFEDDFSYERAKHKIQTFGRHRIFRHPFTGGGAGLVKLETMKKFGPLKTSATTGYWINLALNGFINGFYYPLIYVEHMDDPKSRYCLIKDKESFETAAAVTVGLQAGRYKDLRGRLQWRQEIIRNLMEDPYDPRYYVGWRRKFRSIKNRIHDFITPQSTTKEFDSTND